MQANSNFTARWIHPGWIAVIIGLVTVGAVGFHMYSAQSMGPLGGGGPGPTGGAGVGGFAGVNCTQSGDSACTLAPAGTNWTLGPVSYWCHPETQTTANASGSTSSTYTTCGVEALQILLDIAEPSLITGNVSVSGSYQVWLLPSGWGCDLMAQLTNYPIPCPIPIGIPASATTQMVSQSLWGGTVDLSTLAYSSGAEAGVLLPLPVSSYTSEHLSWSVWIADTETSNVTAAALTPITIVPA